VADEKPPRLRVVVTIQVIEMGLLLSEASQLEWNVRRMVVPVERLKAFDFNQVAEDMLTEVVDMKKE